MYLGKMVELTERNELYRHPMHPYTQALLSSIPIPDPDEQDSKKRIILQGEIPSPIDPPPGCRFKKRCRYAKPICGEQEPILKEISPKHFAACHFFE